MSCNAVYKKLFHKDSNIKGINLCRNLPNVRNKKSY